MTSEAAAAALSNICDHFKYDMEDCIGGDPVGASLEQEEQAILCIIDNLAIIMEMDPQGGTDLLFLFNVAKQVVGSCLTDSMMSLTYIESLRSKYKK